MSGSDLKIPFWKLFKNNGKSNEIIENSSEDEREYEQSLGEKRRDDNETLQAKSKAEKVGKKMKKTESVTMGATMDTAVPTDTLVPSDASSETSDTTSEVSDASTDSMDDTIMDARNVSPIAVPIAEPIAEPVVADPIAADRNRTAGQTHPAPNQPNHLEIGQPLERGKKRKRKGATHLDHGPDHKYDTGAFTSREKNRVHSALTQYLTEHDIPPHHLHFLMHPREPLLKANNPYLGKEVCKQFPTNITEMAGINRSYRQIYFYMRNAFTFLKGPVPTSLFTLIPPTNALDTVHQPLDSNQIIQSNDVPLDPNQIIQNNDVYKRQSLRWTKEQDAILLRHVGIYGTESWKQIEKDMGMFGAKDRYDCLKSGKRGKWKWEEEVEFVKHVQALLAEQNQTQANFNSFTLLASRMGNTRTYREVARHFKVKPVGYFEQLPSPPPLKKKRIKTIKSGEKKLKRTTKSAADKKMEKKIYKSKEFVGSSDDESQVAGQEEDAKEDVDQLASGTDSSSSSDTTSLGSVTDSDLELDDSASICRSFPSTPPPLCNLALYKDLLERVHSIFPTASHESDIDWSRIMRPGESEKSVAQVWRQVVRRAAHVWDLGRMQVYEVVAMCLENIKRLVDIQESDLSDLSNDDDDDE